MVGLGGFQGQRTAWPTGGGGGLPQGWILRAAQAPSDQHRGAVGKRVLIEQGRDGEVGERGCGFEDRGLEGAQPLPQWVVCGLTAPTAGSCL